MTRRSIWTVGGAVLDLVRPLNALLFVVGALVGGLLARGYLAAQAPFRGDLLIAAVSAALIGGGANALNDAVDADIDAINRPRRPIPSGRISFIGATTVWGVASVLGVLAAIAVSPAHVVVAVVLTVLLYIYNVRWKRTAVVGNLVVAVSVAMLLYYGGSAVGSGTPLFVGMCFAFLTTYARETVKDVEDVAGDRIAGARTTAVVLGEDVAGRVGATVMLTCICLTPVPFLRLGFSGLYLLVVLVADFLLLAAALALVQQPYTESAGRASSRLKGAMIVGLAALTVAI